MASASLSPLCLFVFLAQTAAAAAAAAAAASASTSASKKSSKQMGHALEADDGVVVCLAGLPALLEPAVRLLAFVATLVVVAVMVLFVDEPME